MDKTSEASASEESKDGCLCWEYPFIKYRYRLLLF